MSEGVDFWAQHLAAIEREGITIKAYAEREGLSVGMLYQSRRNRKRREDAASSSVANFVAVRLAQPKPVAHCLLRLGHGLELELAELPPVHWLVALHAAKEGC